MAASQPQFGKYRHGLSTLPGRIQASIVAKGAISCERGSAVASERAGPNGPPRAHAIVRRMMVLTATTACAILYGLVSRRYERALAIGAITPAGAALVVGGEAIPTFYAIAVGGAAMLVWQWLARRGGPARTPLSRIPGVLLMIAMLSWSAFVVLAAPIVFPGIETVTVTGWRLQPGALTTTNAAQLIYLALGIVVVVIVARSRTTTPMLLSIPLGVGIGLSLWRYLSIAVGVPFPTGTFDNSPSFKYIEQAAGGVSRFRGISSEPAGLAVLTAVAAAYGLSLAAQLRGLARVASLTMAGVAVFLGIASTSTTFVIEIAVLALLSLLAFCWRLLRPRGSIRPTSMLIALGIVGVATMAVPKLLSLLLSEVNRKFGSSSFDDRSGSDMAALGVLEHTWGLGIGLGSVRASSLLFTLLGATGLIGTALFLASIASLTIPAMRAGGAGPVLWALAAFLISKAISGPDLADTTGLLWLCLGILAHTAIGPRVADTPSHLGGTERIHRRVSRGANSASLPVRLPRTGRSPAQATAV